MMGGWVGSKPYRPRANTRDKVNMDVVPKRHHRIGEYGGDGGRFIPQLLIKKKLIWEVTLTLAY